MEPPDRDHRVGRHLPGAGEGRLGHLHGGVRRGAVEHPRGGAAQHLAHPVGESALPRGAQHERVPGTEAPQLRPDPRQRARAEDGPRRAGVVLEGVHGPSSGSWTDSGPARRKRAALACRARVDRAVDPWRQGGASRAFPRLWTDGVPAALGSGSCGRWTTRWSGLGCSRWPGPSSGAPPSSRRCCTCSPTPRCAWWCSPGRRGSARPGWRSPPSTPLPSTPGCWCRCSSIPDGDVMGDAIAAEVALPGVAIRRPADALWQSFGGHPVLLLLDNLEQVVGAAETLLDLLESYPEVTVLATSLREVGVPGERLVRLAPLEVPRLPAGGRPGRPDRPPPAGRTGRPGAGDVPRAGHGEGRRRPPRGLGPRGGGAHLPQRRGPAAGHPAGGGARGVAARCRSSPTSSRAPVA